MSGSPRYIQYRGAPPPCDRTHRTPPGLPFGQTTPLSTHARGRDRPAAVPPHGRSSRRGHGPPRPGHGCRTSRPRPRAHREGRPRRTRYALVGPAGTRAPRPLERRAGRIRRAGRPGGAPTKREQAQVPGPGAPERPYSRHPRTGHVGLNSLQRRTLSCPQRPLSSNPRRR
ncbi:hypothetical protein DBP18_20650 [Streptomyces sp. CS081A]|nr:hypothetical protein DBP18_20650 [Streptomyces sp. CS081A]